MLLVAAILIAQNLIIFRDHYFNNVGFPWDFPLVYYAIVAFWTTLVSQGVTPHWIPFQSMGYPIAMSLQSGIHYPPLWVFPLLKIPYTLNAAVVFQNLHVLFGAFGMFFWIRQKFSNVWYGLAGAVLFQFFGGFYSNSEHVDIVRAFAFTPWLLYVYTIDDPAGGRIPRRLLLIPVYIFLMATGGYPGNFLAAVFILGIYTVFQLFHMAAVKVERRILLTIGGLILFMTFLGIGVSFFHLGPTWLYKGYMYRYSAFGNLGRFGLGLQHIPGLILSNKVMQDEISMTSTYITLPAFLLLFFVSLRQARRYWFILATTMLATLMLAGPRSFIWSVITGALSPLQFSRFPASDYRAFVAIGLIFFALVGLRSIVNNEHQPASLLLRTLAAIICVLYVIYLSRNGLSQPELINATLVGILTIAFIYMMNRFPGRLQHMAPALLIVLSVFNAANVLPRIPTWRENNYGLYDRNNWPLTKNGRLLTYFILEGLNGKRPSRTERPLLSMMPFEGYITGNFISNDLLPPILISARQAEHYPLYRNYMLLDWQPILLDPPIDEQPVYLSDEYFPWGNRPERPEVRQIQYGINEISYQVNLSEPQLMVENEIYFPGWQAYVVQDGQRIKIDALEANAIFRAWKLPAGSYEMTAFFHFPYEKAFYAVSAAAAVWWLLVALFIWQPQRFPAWLQRLAIPPAVPTAW